LNTGIAPFFFHFYVYFWFIAMAGLVLARVVDPETARRWWGLLRGWGDDKVRHVSYFFIFFMIFSNLVLLIG